MRALTLVFGLALSFLVAGALTAPDRAEAQVVRAIQVEGNQRIDADTVRSYLSLQVGRSYSPVLADDSLQSLFETGLFQDANIARRGSTVVVTVVENPIINRVAFEGNKRLKDEVLASEVQLQQRSTFSRARVQADTQRIIQLYRRTGRFGARVEPKIIELPQNRVDLVYEIDEDRKTGVSRISFIGNEAFGDGTLREVITTTQSNFLSFLKATDVYDPDRVEADQELLRRYYLKKGYADFRVVSAFADYDQESNSFFITFTVDEGPRYRFGNVEIETAIPEIDSGALRSKVRTRPGDYYNAELVDRTLEGLTVEVATAGYAFARVRPIAMRNDGDLTIDIIYTIEEGPRVYIERLEIVGNTRTLDRVIRREFDLAEGDAFNAVLIQRAERRLNALGYFKSVRVSRSPGSTPDRVVVTVFVEEQPTGELSAGVGFSTSDGIIGDVSITERNLLGRGQIVRAAVGVSGDRTTFDFSFTDPWFLDRRVAAGFDLFYRDVNLEDESSYTSEQRGGSLRFGFLLAEDLTMNVRYTIRQEEIIIGNSLLPDFDQNDDGDFADALDRSDLSVDGILAIQRNLGDVVVGDDVSPYILSTEGTTLTSSVGTTIKWDKLDFPREPRNGYFAELSVDVAGLGGDKYYGKVTAEARAYKEVFPNIIALARVQGGVIQSFDGDPVAINDSFFQGSGLVRGFANSGIGPRAQRTLPGPDGILGTADDDIDELDALGGQYYWGATAEVRFPIPLLPSSFGFSGAVFADAGSLYDVGDLGNAPTIGSRGKTDTTAGNDPSPIRWDVLDDASVRASAGFSVLWKSPFGPLRGDFAWPLAQEDYDDTQFFRFSGGTRF